VQVATSGQIWKGKKLEQIVLPDMMIQRIEAMIKKTTSKKKVVLPGRAVMIISDDMKIAVEVYRCLHSKYSIVALLH